MDILDNQTVLFEEMASLTEEVSFLTGEENLDLMENLLRKCEYYFEVLNNLYENVLEQEEDEAMIVINLEEWTQELQIYKTKILSLCNMFRSICSMLTERIDNLIEENGIICPKYYSGHPGRPKFEISKEQVLYLSLLLVAAIDLSNSFALAAIWVNDLLTVSFEEPSFELDKVEFEFDAIFLVNHAHFDCFVCRL